MKSYLKNFFPNDVSQIDIVNSMFNILSAQRKDSLQQIYDHCDNVNRNDVGVVDLELLIAVQEGLKSGEGEVRQCKDNVQH